MKQEMTMKKIKHRKVINASGKMSILGTSVMNEKVIEGMAYGAKNFFIMSEYLKEIEEDISKMTGYGASKITASAAASIALTTAAVVGRGNSLLAKHPHLENHLKRDIILPKGHNVNFGAPIDTMVELGGGKVVEAGYANECSKDQILEQVTENTAGILYIKSHHSVQKNILSIKDALEISKETKIPLIVDAAAEEDILAYNDLGIDFVIYSGSKAMEGPSSAIVLGQKESISWMDALDTGIARAMKVSKESASGLYQAIYQYLEKENLGNAIDLNKYYEEVNSITGLSATINQDPAGREIYRLAVKSDKENAQRIIKEFEKGNPAIFTRNYLVNDGVVEIDTRSLNDSNMQTIVKKLKELF